MQDASGLSQGSGLVLRSLGVVLTANHIVEWSTRAYVRSNDGARAWADVIWRDAQADIALLRPISPLRGAEISWASSLPQPGSEVFALGYPAPLGYGGGVAITRGIVSRTLRLGTIDYIQTDAAVNPGNSGGPIVDACGNLLGVVVAKFQGLEGQGVAVAAPAIARRMGSAGIASVPQVPSPQPCGPNVRPQQPEEAVRLFYQLASSRRYAEAYCLMGRAITSRTDLATFTGWFRNKVAIVPVTVTVVSRQVGEATVEALVLSSDSVGGPIVTRWYREVWRVRYEDGWWRLSERLETTPL